jgi:hypothetical protein
MPLYDRYLGRTGTTSVVGLLEIGIPSCDALAVCNSCSARSRSEMLEGGGG